MNPKSKQEQMKQLLDAMQDVRNQKQYNIADDLQQLLDASGYLKLKDLKAKIRGLIDKYTAGEQTEVHAALIARCCAGDINAIRLYNSLQSSGQDADTSKLDAILTQLRGNTNG